MAVRWRERAREERSVVMSDGAVKGANAEALAHEAGNVAAAAAAAGDSLGYAGRFAAAVVALSWWMILMTAIYFHTWFEKVRRLFSSSLSAFLSRLMHC